MTEEINQLKRGRVSGKARAPKKNATVGEISDPTSVLNDSISQKNSPSSSQQAEVLIQETTVESAPTGKTTTVDELLVDEVLDSKPNRRPRNDQRNRRRDANHHDTKTSHDRSSCRPEGSAPRTTENPSCSRDGQYKECACCHALKRAWCKLLEFLGFKSKRPHTHSSKGSTGENRHRRSSSNGRRPRNNRTKSE
ncbi:MAG: hypothetical protein LW808_002745 [Verrucomicrobiota bacterium]|nr:MAG: hypothetical protein LW808_002745 [Verrucomicrobiota bacterium]